MEYAVIRLTIQPWGDWKMIIGKLLMAIVLPVLGFAAIGLTTWGLISKDVNPDGVGMAVGGLVAYLIVWNVGLFMIRPSSAASE